MDAGSGNQVIATWFTEVESGYRGCRLCLLTMKGWDLEGLGRQAGLSSFSLFISFSNQQGSAQVTSLLHIGRVVCVS